MLRTAVKLLIAPVLAVICLALGYAAGRHSFALFFDGTHTSGRIVAMVKEHGVKGVSDVYFGMRAVVRCRTAAGAELAGQLDGAVMTGVVVTADGTTTHISRSELERIRGLSRKALKAEPLAMTVALLADLLEANVQTMERRAEKEFDRTDDQRPVFISKEEKVLIIRGITGQVTAVCVEGNAVTAAVTAAGVHTTADELAVTVTAEPHAPAEDSAAGNATGAVIRTCTVVRTLNGVAEEDGNADFISFEKTSDYTFWPVVVFRAGDISVTRITAVGRRLTVPPEYRLGVRTKVAYDPRDCDDAQLIPDFDKIRQLPPLMRFNSYIEAIFGLWLYPAMLITMGAIFGVAGLILLSMAVWPGVSPEHLHR
ncbi:hypothetical protein GX586_11445 [bacterium]|nr:hypothetical protein [bacterium]